jgi:hypothetical protein
MCGAELPIRQRAEAMLPRPMANVRFKLSTGDEFFKSVDSEEEAAREVQLFRLGQTPYTEPWFEVDNGIWLSRDAVVVVMASGDPSVPLVG